MPELPPPVKTAGDRIVLALLNVLIPSAVYLARRNWRYREKLRGFIITSSILFLLNAGCWGLIAARLETS